MPIAIKVSTQDLDGHEIRLAHFSKILFFFSNNFALDFNLSVDQILKM